MLDIICPILAGLIILIPIGLTICTAFVLLVVHIIHDMIKTLK